jgi:hypothetical protein
LVEVLKPLLEEFPITRFPSGGQSVVLSEGVLQLQSAPIPISREEQPVVFMEVLNLQ